MLTKIPFLRDAAEIVLAHQEFFDGTGYPADCAASRFLGARIFSLADAMDAMISDRPYRKALPMSHAREEIAAAPARSSIPRSWKSFSRFRAALG